MKVKTAVSGGGPAHTPGGTHARDVEGQCAQGIAGKASCPHTQRNVLQNTLISAPHDCMRVHS